MSRLSIVLWCLALAACNQKKAPAPPVVGTASAPATLRGGERIGWDQPAATSAELATIHYVVYLDNVRTPLTDVSCATSPTTIGPSTFACTARLPTLTPGAHTLELASIADDGTARESVRSGTLHVTMVPAATP
jgi:hypothetical protein